MYIPCSYRDSLWKTYFLAVADYTSRIGLLLRVSRDDLRAATSAAMEARFMVSHRRYCLHAHCRECGCDVELVRQKTRVRSFLPDRWARAAKSA